MNRYRLVIFLTNSTTPIIISEETSQTREELHKKIEDLFKSRTIVKIVTKTDSLFIKPSVVTAILIEEISGKNTTTQTKDEAKPIKKNLSPKKDGAQDNPVLRDEQENPYKQALVIK